MSNRNKIIVLAILIALVGVPYWRITSNSEFYVNGIMNHLGHLGTWNHKSIDTSLNGKVTVRGIRFIPKGYRQAISIDSIDVHSDMRKLLFKGAHELTTHVPNNLTLSFNGVRFDGNATDFQTVAVEQNYWPMTAGYLGAFGCGEGPTPNFTADQWRQIVKTNPNFNIELSYSLIDPYHLDFNLNVDSPDNWFVAWSGTLTRTSDVAKITFNDTIIDTLYYYHADQGFNKKRNEYCGKKQGSIPAYRVKSADEIQSHLRVYLGKEMPSLLSNKYQRSLAENIEVNVIFKLNEPKYIFEFANMSQTEFISSNVIEAALGEQEYEEIALADIDFINLDMETLRAEMEAKEQETKRKEEEPNAPKELLKTVKHTIGGRAPDEYVVSDWNSAIGQNIKIRTKRGRPIFGKLLAISGSHLTVSSRYIKGNATITVAKKDVVRMTRVR
jgi:hypothetical protein